MHNIKGDDLNFIDCIIRRLCWDTLIKNENDNIRGILKCFKIQNYSNSDEYYDLVIGIPILSKSFTYYSYIDEEEEKETNDIPINFYINKIQTIREQTEKELIEYGLIHDIKFI